MKLFDTRLWPNGLLVLACGALSVCATGCVQETKPASFVQVTPAEIGVPPAKIRKVDALYHFVVLDFSQRAMPPLGARLTVYRNGKEIGDVRITEPVRAQFATADILTGDPHVGDDVR